MDRDSEADFHDFVVSRSPALLRTAYLLTGDRHRAEDLLQSALARALRHWSKISAAGTAEPYVRRILVNEHRSWWRSARNREIPVAELPDGAAPAGELEGFSDRDLVWRALQQLAPRTRAVLVLRYWEDRSEAETATLLDCSAGTVKSLAHRGLRRLADVLADARPAGAHEGRAS
ncbi:MAG TPA: SigE family RNA polymerase sigma factor [Mycobacteriales bacterium]|jgi:RNA polymerase sigma-70 factor (sigma-E family)|nr:SigE family RNA polymerase sigma factor [Mycobacteriales bacterium]